MFENGICAILKEEAVYQDLEQVKQMGFNCLKLCLFVPHPSFFDMAYRLGILL